VPQCEAQCNAQCAAGCDAEIWNWLEDPENERVPQQLGRDARDELSVFRRNECEFRSFITWTRPCLFTKRCHTLTMASAHHTRDVDALEAFVDDALIWYEIQ
jgi:hypothetical protein